MEAAGVERMSTLTARESLIPGSTARAKKDLLPDPFYVYYSKSFSFGRSIP